MRTSTRTRPFIRSRAPAVNSPHCATTSSSKSKLWGCVGVLSALLFTATNLLLHFFFSEDLVLFSSWTFLGKHACVKDENEAMAGEHDRVPDYLRSDLGGQGKSLNRFILQY